MAISTPMGNNKSILTNKILAHLKLLAYSIILLWLGYFFTMIILSSCLSFVSDKLNLKSSTAHFPLSTASSTPFYLPPILPVPTTSPTISPASFIVVHTTNCHTSQTSACPEVTPPIPSITRCSIVLQMVQQVRMKLTDMVVPVTAFPISTPRPKLYISYAKMFSPKAQKFSPTLCDMTIALRVSSLPNRQLSVSSSSATHTAVLNISASPQPAPKRQRPKAASPSVPIPSRHTTSPTPVLSRSKRLSSSGLKPAVSVSSLPPHTPPS